MQRIFDKKLDDIDQELLEIIKKENRQQQCTMNFRTNENNVSISVLQCLGSCLHNNYSQGQPRKRNYGHSPFIDSIELLTQSRALEAFSLSHLEWGCNVQPYSDRAANLAVYLGLFEPHTRIMGLDLDNDDFRSGFFTTNMKISTTSKFFQPISYKVDEKTGLIDYKKMKKLARIFKPNIIIAGGPSYVRNVDYRIFKEIAREINACLLADISHIAGLVCATTATNPFHYCDIVVTSTYETLRGPRGGIIFYRKGIKSLGNNCETIMYDFEDRINQAVFPGLQGGVHIHVIAGIATALRHAKYLEFINCQIQSYENAIYLCHALKILGYKIVTDGTDTNFFIIDFKNDIISGSQAALILEKISITCEICTVPGDTNIKSPSGIKLGTLGLATRGFTSEQTDFTSKFIDEGLQLARNIYTKLKANSSTFSLILETDANIKAKIKNLRDQVEKYMKCFSIPTTKNYVI